LPRFPAVERDLSVLCDGTLPAGDVVACVTREGGEALRSVAIVDRYDRPPVPAGRVSLTLSLRYQASERTLTGDEVQKSVDRVMIGLRTLGAEIRGE
jgi:phenylalanyl-tRNA synthetase beta chain